MHADGEVLALYDASVGSRRIGVSDDWGHLRRREFGWALASFAFARGWVHLDASGEVHRVAYGIFMVSLPSRS